MPKKYSKLVCGGLFLIIISLSFLSFNSSCQASKADLDNQLNKAGIQGWGIKAEASSMTLIIQFAIQAFLGLLGIIFLVLIIYAGFEWMTAQGDEEKVTKAKDTLQRAIIGLVIITAAYAITYFVFNSLSGGGGTGAVGTGDVDLD